MKVILPVHVKADAEMFADSEAKRGTKAWQRAFYKYCQEMYSTSLIPAEGNPATGEMTVLRDAFPEIFKTFAAKKGDTSINQKRLAGVIENLTLMFMELELGLNTRRGQGKADIFSMPKGASETQQREIYANRYTRMLVRNVVAESLLPFFALRASDLNTVVAQMGLEDEQDVNNLKSPQYMKKFSEALRSVLNHVFGEIEIRKVSLKTQMLKAGQQKSGAV